MSSNPTGTIDQQYADPASYRGDLPPDWDARRKATYRRDDWSCKHCGIQSGPHAPDTGVRLHAHHVTPRSENGLNDLANLVTLCEECHQAVHDHDIFDDGWQGDDDDLGPLFGATQEGWIVAALVSIVGFLFLRALGNHVGLFVGLSGLTGIVVFAALYAGLVLLVVWRPLSATAGYGLFGVVFTGFVFDTWHTAAAPEPMLVLVIAWGPVALLSGALALGKLKL